jgi:MarR family transcriptional regulator, 2-MHQ and catechol-resistance regulon repressor
MDKTYFRAMLQIIITGHWLTDSVTRELKEFDSTEPQFNVLRVLNAKPETPCSVQEIQKGMVQKSSNVTRIVDKLLKKGYVQRKLNKTNRRKVDITITAHGKKFLAQLEEKVFAFHAPLQNNLTPEECVTLTNLIKKLKG